MGLTQDFSLYTLMLSHGMTDSLTVLQAYITDSVSSTALCLTTIVIAVQFVYVIYGGDFLY